MANYLFGLCNPKRNIQSFTNPPVRVELQANPYSFQIPDPSNRNNMRLITQTDLDMRRKVEILKYNSNNVSTQTNGLTKSQKWSNIVSNKTTYVAGSSSSKINKINVSGCPEKPTPSDHSDIPGEVVILYQNNDVPLYNYNVNMFSHSILPPSTLKNWLNDLDSNVSVYSLDVLAKSKYLVYSTITNIYIQNTGRDYYNFELTTPIAFTFSGIYKPLTPVTPPNESTLSLSIIKTYLTIHYNGDVVGNENYPINNVFQNTKYTFKIAQTTDSSSNIGFKATVFLTNLKWDCIKLPNNGNFTYSFNLNMLYNFISNSEKIVLDPTNDIIIDGIYTTSSLSSHYFLANFITTQPLIYITNDLSCVVISYNEVIPDYSIYLLREIPGCYKIPLLISYTSSLDENQNVFFTIKYYISVDANNYNVFINPLPLSTMRTIVNNKPYFTIKPSTQTPVFNVNNLYAVKINAVYDNFITDYSNIINCVYLTPPLLDEKQVFFKNNNVNFQFLTQSVYNINVSYYAMIKDSDDNVIISPTIVEKITKNDFYFLYVRQEDPTVNANKVFFKNTLYKVQIRVGYYDTYSEFSSVQQLIYLSPILLLNPIINGNFSFIIPYETEKDVPDYPRGTIFNATINPVYDTTTNPVVIKAEKNTVSTTFIITSSLDFTVVENTIYNVKINPVYGNDANGDYSNIINCVYLTPPLLDETKNKVFFSKDNVNFQFEYTNSYDSDISFYAKITDINNNEITDINNHQIIAPIIVEKQFLLNTKLLYVHPPNIRDQIPVQNFVPNTIYKVQIRAGYNGIYSDYSAPQECIYLSSLTIYDPVIISSGNFRMDYTPSYKVNYPVETQLTIIAEKDPMFLPEDAPHELSETITGTVREGSGLKYIYFNSSYFLFNIYYNIHVSITYDNGLDYVSNDARILRILPPNLTTCVPSIDDQKQLQLSIIEPNVSSYPPNVDYSVNIFERTTDFLMIESNYNAIYNPLKSDKLLISSNLSLPENLFTYFIKYLFIMHVIYGKKSYRSNEDPQKRIESNIISYVFVAPPRNMRFNQIENYFTFNFPIVNPDYPLSLSLPYNTYNDADLNSSFDFRSINNYIPVLNDNRVYIYNNGLQTGIHTVSSCDNSPDAYKAFTNEGFSLPMTDIYTTIVNGAPVQGPWLQIRLPIPVYMTNLDGYFDLDLYTLVCSSDGYNWREVKITVTVITVTGNPTVYSNDTFTFYKFTKNGTIISESNIKNIDILMVGGGGGGGTIQNTQGHEGQGGGGAGQMVVGSINLNIGSTYTITVGNGGASNKNGGDSYISGTHGIYTAIGGGAGGYGNSDIFQGNFGKDGGSGGGGCGYSNTGIGGNALFPIDTKGLNYYGNSGGNSIHFMIYTDTNDSCGGGGGGAGSKGLIGGTVYLGDGGNGQYWNGDVYAGGGGGGCATHYDVGTSGGRISIGGNSGGKGGRGGGGNGCDTVENFAITASIIQSTPGTPNTGGGGGGGGSSGNIGQGITYTPGSPGGSGVVIFKIPNISQPELPYQYYRFIYRGSTPGLFKNINFTATPDLENPAFAATSNNPDKVNMNAYYGATWGNSVNINLANTPPL